MTYEQLKELVIEELGQTDRLDRFLDRWIQQSIDFIYGSLEFESLLRSITITTVTGTETVSLPADYGDIVSLVYAPGDGTGYKLTQITPNQFFTSFPDQNVQSFVQYFCIYDGLIFLSPLPADSYTLILRYRIASVNVFVHEFNIEDDDNASSVGVSVYIDEDAISSYKQIGMLYFISPTETDAKIKVNSSDGHQHEITIYHSATALSLGATWYFDENGAYKNKRNLFISPTGKDCVVQTDKYRDHSHYIRFMDNDTAGSIGTDVRLDEDQVDKTKRIRFVSPTNTDGTGELVPSVDELLPPFVEQYQEGIVLGAIAKGFRYKKEHDAANEIKKDLGIVLKSYQRTEERKSNIVVEAKPFGSGARGIWDSLKFPTIDD